MKVFYDSIHRLSMPNTSSISQMASGITSPLGRALRIVRDPDFISAGTVLDRKDSLDREV